MKVICPYCNQPATLLMDSSALYHGHDYGPVWICRLCQAWVGVHKNSKDFAPLGRLANAELRRAKIAAHSAFDRLWKAKMHRDGCSKTQARKAAYAWLAGEMEMESADCHIGKMALLHCRKVVEICEKIGA